MAKLPKTREPEPGTKAAETIERWRRAGIEIKMEEHDANEHRLLFFGRVPEDPDSSAESAKTTPTNH